MHSFIIYSVICWCFMGPASDGGDGSGGEPGGGGGKDDLSEKSKRKRKKKTSNGIANRVSAITASPASQLPLPPPSKRRLRMAIPTKKALAEVEAVDLSLIRKVDPRGKRQQDKEEEVAGKDNNGDVGASGAPEL